jgi:hypothetical protein
MIDAIARIATVQVQVAELAEIYGAESVELALIRSVVLFFLGRQPQRLPTLAPALRGPQQVGHERLGGRRRQLPQRVPENLTQIPLR